MFGLIGILLSVLPSALKVPVYRLLGMKIGRGVRIGYGTLLLCRDVEIEAGARIGHFCLVRAAKLRLGKRAVIQNMVRIGVHTLEVRSQGTICSSNEISGAITDPRSRLYLGPASWILPHCFVNVFRPITIGRNVGVGGGSYLFTHGMWLSKLDGFPVSYGPIDIEDDVWLPWSCFIMPNVTIGSRVIVGARSLVNKSLPADVLAAGSPAKVIREQSSSPITTEQRLEVLAEISADLAASQGGTARVETTPEVERHYLGDTLVLLIHKAPGAAPAPAPALNIVLSPLDRQAARQAPTWSLADHTASPYDMISPLARRWFGQARTLGVRYYPIDEDLD